MEEEILKIIDNSQKLRESYFINNYIEIFYLIKDYTKNLDIPFKQRIWHFLNKEPDYIKCKVCGKRVSFNKNWLDGYKSYCSQKCAQSSEETKNKRIRTVSSKYGVDNIAKLDDIKKKQENTNLEKYGYKSSFQNKKVRDKWSKSIENKWGVDHIFKSDIVKNKSILKTLDKWGVEHFVQSDEYKNKLEYIGFSDKLKKIYIEKHIKKYLIYDLEFIELNDRILKLKSNKCGHEFKIHYDSLKRRIDNGYEYCTICNNINSGQSQEEIKLIEWIKSIGLNIIEKDRSLGIELDIYIPDYKIAIEYNGLYWHSELYKNNEYHLNKTNICNSNGVRLIHIWEDDWLYKNKIVRSIILNSIGLINSKIYSRKCRIVSVNNINKNNFLEENHIQGSCSSSINIGLEYNGELVSLMTFGKRSINSKDEFELLRFCNKVDTLVIGGASKLFNFFNKKYEYNNIISYADISQFTGDLYKKLGFKYLHRSKPNYWWVIDGVRHHRFEYNKKRLVKEGADPLKTEVEIMYSKGYFRIFGSGQDKYIY